MPLAIDYVYTDRARTISRKAGPRIEGETQMEEYLSQWFLCRIAPAEGKEVRDAERRGEELTHTLIAKLTDLDGHATSIKPQDRLEVTVQSPTGQTFFGKFEIAGNVTRPRNLVEELLYVVPLRILREY